MKKLISLIAVMVLCLSFVGCTADTADKAQKNEIIINIKNDVVDQFKNIGTTFYLGDKAIGSSGVENADGSLLGKEEFSFHITKDDIAGDADLSDFRIAVSVTDASDASYDVCDLAFVPEFGKEYAFVLKSEESGYYLWVANGGSAIGAAEDDPTAEEQSPKNTQSADSGKNQAGAGAQSVDLTGPWHLDSKKNDLNAFQDIFPCYAEFGASMEIKSNGQISWYIGAEGGHGTYTMDGDTLTAELISDVDQKPMTVVFRVTVENENALLTMDYNGTPVCWEYGDSMEPNAAGE